MLLAELALNDIRERVRHLVLGSEDATDQCRARDRYGVDRAEVGRIKATLYKRLHIELQVEPNAFKNHSRRNARMHGLARYVILRVGVLRPGEENKPLFLLLLVAESHLHMELLLVQDLHL